MHVPDQESEWSCTGIYFASVSTVTVRWCDICFLFLSS